MDNLESRVTDLEIQITHQIKMLEELNSVIISQQKHLEKIETISSFLLQNIQSSHDYEGSPISTIFGQKPPHY